MFSALEALPKGGQLTIRTRPTRSWSPAGVEGVRVVVADTGCGKSEAARKQIFEPFFTTKQLGGSGLGLWLSLGIVSKHGGRIRLRTSTRSGSSGTCFSVVLPLAQSADDDSNRSLEGVGIDSWQHERTA